MFNWDLRKTNSIKSSIIKNCSIDNWTERKESNIGELTIKVSRFNKRPFNWELIWRNPIDSVEECSITQDYDSFCG